jgi:hypothetical protein
LKPGIGTGFPAWSLFSAARRQCFVNSARHFKRRTRGETEPRLRRDGEAVGTLLNTWLILGIHIHNIHGKNIGKQVQRFNEIVNKNKKKPAQ